MVFKVFVLIRIHFFFSRPLNVEALRLIFTIEKFVFHCIEINLVLKRSRAEGLCLYAETRNCSFLGAKIDFLRDLVK